VALVATLGFRTVQNEDIGTLFKSITVRNLLSFGPDAEPLPLENLNVLIGPNGSGKSNLLEAIALLRSTPQDKTPLDMRSVIARGGGISEWIWKGAPEETATIEGVTFWPESPPDWKEGRRAVRHLFEFRQENQRFRLVDERIEDEQALEGHPEPYFFYKFQAGHPVINEFNSKKGRLLKPETVSPDTSILTQIRDPESYPELSHLARSYGQISIYQDWAFGRNSICRSPQKADLPSEPLEEDFSNLGLFLNQLRDDANTTSTLLKYLSDLYEGITDFFERIKGGTVQVFFKEGPFTLPASRLSDGTMRYLCLLAILCDPDPPPFLGIEEPELGLHPDVIPKIAELLIAASSRTQLVVTTHSDVLVDALSERPGAVVVCEKHGGATTMRRLDAAELSPWLEEYRLGQLWARGDFGGNRW
jgi:predicted ATPase